MREKISDIIGSYVGSYFKKKDKEELLENLMNILEGSFDNQESEDLNAKKEAEKKKRLLEEKKRKQKASRTAVVAEPTTDEYGNLKTVFRRHEVR